MHDDEFLDAPGEREFVGEKSNAIGAVNMALLFGTAMIALSLILTPLLSAQKDQMEASTIGYDDIKTGSIPTSDGKVKRYIIRRSVLQDNPGEGCIINEDGRRTDC